MNSFHADSDGKAMVQPTGTLQWLAENSVDDELPGDLSAEHDYYLYGTPKRADTSVPR